jgi:DNA-binding beta-propeller fold protein YncE
MTFRHLLLAGLLAPIFATSAVASEFPANKLFVGSAGTDRILIYRETGDLNGSLGATTALQDPASLAFGPDGHLYVVSADSHAIYVFDPDSAEPQTSFGASAGLVSPRGAAFGPDGNLYVGDGGSGTVFVFDRQGNYLHSVGTGSGLSAPCALTFSADGHLFVASADSGRIHEFDPSGALLQVLGENTDLVRPVALAMTANGNLLVSSETTNSVLVFGADGQQLAEIGAGSQLSQPGGVAVGPDGHLYVASRGTDKVMVFSTNGSFVRSFGKKLSGASDLAFAPFRFNFKTNGTLARGAENLHKIKQGGTLIASPGSNQITVFFADSPGGVSLADSFGSDVLVMSGGESYASDSSRKRRFHGDWTPDDPTRGLASVSLIVDGKVSKKTGYYEMKGAKGSLLQAGAGGVYLGSCKTGKVIK